MGMVQPLGQYGTPEGELELYTEYLNKEQELEWSGATRDA